MKFILLKASDFNFNNHVEVATLGDLKKLEKEYGNDLVISFEKKEIIIYDTYLE